MIGEMTEEQIQKAAISAFLSTFLESCVSNKNLRSAGLIMDEIKDAALECLKAEGWK